MALGGVAGRAVTTAERWFERKLARVVEPRYPGVAIEITARHVVVVSVGQASDGTRSTLREHRVVDLPPGLIQPSLQRSAITSLDGFRLLLRGALDGLSGLAGKVSLVLPDVMVKVSFVPLETVELHPSEAPEILRWKLKRSTPFRVEDARIAYQVFPRPNGGSRCMALLSLEQVVAPFEDVLGSLGVEVGLIDFSSFCVWNLIESQLPVHGDSLFINVGVGYATLILARDREPLFVRCKTPIAGEVELVDVVSELQPTLLYYQDRVGGSGLASVLVRAPAAMLEGLRAEFEAQFQICAEAIGTGETDGVPAGMSVMLAPALGAALGR